MNFRFEATSWSSPLPYNSRCSVRLVWPLAHEIIRATIIYCYQSSCFWPVGAFVPSQSRSVEGSGVSRVSPGNRTRNPGFLFLFPLPSSIRAIFLHGRETALRVILSAYFFNFRSMRSPLPQTRNLHRNSFTYMVDACSFFFFFVSLKCYSLNLLV